MGTVDEGQYTDTEDPKTGLRRQWTGARSWSGSGNSCSMIQSRDHSGATGCHDNSTVSARVPVVKETRVKSNKLGKSR